MIQHLKRAQNWLIRPFAITLESSSNRAFAGILTLLAGLGVVATVFTPYKSSNSRIYSAIANYVNQNGRLPGSGHLIGPHNINGTYADFPGLSLWVYRILLGHSVEVPRLLWALWEIVPVLTVCIAMLSLGNRLNLVPLVIRATTLVAISCAILVAIPLEDKTYFFWLPLTGFLLATVDDFLGAAVIGIFVGWTGLAPFALLIPMIQIGRPFRRIKVTVIGVICASITFFAAGSMTLSLAENRAHREQGPSFWFSIWQFTGHADTPFIRGIFAGTLELAILATLVWKRDSLFSGAIIVMSAVTLLSSNSTVPMRLIMLLPLSVFVCRTRRSQVTALAGVLAWMLMFVIGEIAPYGFKLTAQATSPIVFALQVIWVNLPILAIVTIWLNQIISSHGRGRIITSESQT